uniref:Putative ovule protein n=1 Tax=Solanum chacoense TaxID=4108 RepID=A0A0V0H1L4_SOLCH
MADFSFLSDSDNEKAVEDLLSQAMDQSVLEQVPPTNCFTDSVFPNQLETHFRKLKIPSYYSDNSKTFYCRKKFQEFRFLRVPKHP